MLPIWTALAGLAIGMGYAAISQRRRAGRPQPVPRLLDADTVEQINALVIGGKPIRAIKLLRKRTGLSLLAGKNRIDDWHVDEERAAALSQ